MHVCIYIYTSKNKPLDKSINAYIHIDKSLFCLIGYSFQVRTDSDRRRKEPCAGQKEGPRHQTPETLNPDTPSPKPLKPLNPAP